MSFWTLREVTPKLKDRFIVLINNQIHINAKSVNKPTLTFENKEYRMINHYFKYPGLPKWNTVKIVFVDMKGEIPDTRLNDLAAATIGMQANAAVGAGAGGVAALATSLTVDTANTTAFLSGDSTNAAEYLWALATAGGYENPTGTKTPSKSLMNTAINNIAIQQISPGGIPGDIPKVVEQWTLINPKVFILGRSCLWR